ncbi:MAG TPA: protease pro-enzyme activation domain-containing protein, partial [Bryobacteraceae bacterium]|nr:protease pro-enzyme activation domain-containing protein [Bryobacteraceae bacterium]
MRFRRTAYSLVIFVAVLLLFVTPIHAATSQILQGHAAEAIRASRVIDRVPAATEMKLAIGLPLRNPDELEKFLKQLVDPASPGYRHYLTPEQFAERYAPSEEEYQALADYFRANGFAVTGTHSNRTILDVSGTASEIERVLHVNMMHWNHPVRGEFFAPDRDPSIDAGVTVLDISGLDNFVLPRPMNLKPHPLTDVQPLTTGSGPAGLFIGNDYRAAYAPGVTLNGAGQAVGLLELDGFYASDVQSNFSKAGLTPVPVQTVLLNGYNGAPGNANVEVILDIMMAAYMAPGLSKVIVYEGYNPDDVLNRMATDNQARQLSSSWGWSPMDAIVDQIFKQMIAQGQSLFQASGDDGAYRGAVMPPADDPNITVVGGTSLTTAGAGGAWLSETAWSGSGGGVSTTWPIPSYQQSVNMAAIGGSSTKRNLPDVSLLADIQIFLICNNGQQIMVGGTSAAAPLWAGFIALANQQAVANHQPAVGFLNPAIYALGAGPNYQSDLHDIIAGSNGFSAMPGYDLATGWGSPTGQPLINALTATTATPGFSLLSSATALSLAPGANGTATITINPQQGFTGNVSLAISGLPAGVTGAFSPATAVTTSTVTITAASSAVASSSTVTITGTSGSLTGTARLTLTITGTPSFTVSAMPATLNVTRGSIGTSSITVMPQGDFRGSVTLSASGLPTGVSASFSPGTGSSLLSLTAGSAATLGNATITITGTSGSLRSSTTIALTVTAPAPGFTIAASPASISLKPGASAPTTISVSLQTGFSGTVAFSLDGLPTGVTGTFNPPTTNRSTTLTLVAAANAVPGTSTITVKGTSGTIIARATIALTISAPPSFTLTAAPASLTVLAGASGTSTITVTPQGGFASAVALTASGLPAGVTATFTPASTTRTSVVTFTASSAAVAASATVNITGTSGALSSRVAIALTITKP